MFSTDSSKSSGPVGVGKSHLLYLLTAEFRMSRQLYRVTYINDCKKWIRNPIGYILKELVTTFYNDTIAGMSIVEWCEKIDGNDKLETVATIMEMLEALISYIRTRELQWIVVCDQHNALFGAKPVVNAFPYNIIDFLSSFGQSGVKVIISASANNEGVPSSLEGWLTHDISAYSFDAGEFSSWCIQYPLKDGTVIDPVGEDAIEALYWSGNKHLIFRWGS